MVCAMTANPGELSRLGGTVFEIAKTANGYASSPTTLVSVPGYPAAGPIADANGNLFGTTAEGGPSHRGTVFEIAKTAGGYASTPTTLASFNGPNGWLPAASLFRDANGNLFGTTALGGASITAAYVGYGTVFEIVNNGSNTAPSYASAPTTLVSFNGTDGTGPEAGLIADANGNLFGTTFEGGDRQGGTVFEIVNNGTNTAPSYASAPTILISFSNSFNAGGRTPVASLIADANGNLFGTTAQGGPSDGGTVFEIAKTAGGHASTPTILANFDGPPNGLMPQASLIAALSR